MGLKNAPKIITLVFSVYFTVTANENFQQYVPCKPGWYFFGENCYKIYPNLSNWENSEKSCILNGGHLTSIHSDELQEFLTSVLLLNSKSNAWIGFNTPAGIVVFSWVDGSLKNYTNWDSSQPSIVLRPFQRNCAEMRYKDFQKRIGSWNDELCTALRPYMCQVDKNSDTKSPNPQYCSVEDGGGWKYLNSCYHIVMEEKTWEDAEKYCEENYKGYLVSIFDDNTEIFLDYIMKISNLSKSIWIGIKMENYSMQKWTSGWHVANKKINQELLHFVNGTCVTKSNLHSLGNASCHNKYPFICEKIKYNVPALLKPLSDNWKCPQSSKKLLDLGGDSCYYIESTFLRNWLQANYECGKIGGTLASFHSENETKILHPHVLDTQKQLLSGREKYLQERLWIGLRSSSVKKDTYEWADGTKIIYENWKEFEPIYLNNMCVELLKESMEWNDVVCYSALGYICKTKKVFTYSNMEEVLKYGQCDSAVSKEQKYSGDIPMGTVVGIVLSTLIVSLFVGVILCHYQDYWKRDCTKTEKDGFTSTTEGSCGHVSDTVIWKPQGKDC